MTLTRTLRQVRAWTAVMPCVLMLAVAQGAEPTNVSGKATSDLNAARQAGWKAASVVIESLQSSDQKAYPGIQAWLKDFRKQTQGLDQKASPDTWPAVDADGLMAHNASFWRAYYEIAPGDPGIAVIHAGLLLGCGEATRALHVIEFYHFRPGIPKSIDSVFAALAQAAKQAGKQSNAVTQAGVQLFDAGDYAGAVKKYREALRVWPQNGWACYELGFTIRTEEWAASGEKPSPLNSIQVNDRAKAKFSSEVKAAFADSRRYTPFQFMAYQGDDQAVIQGFLALVKKVQPAMKTLAEAGDPASVDQALQRVSEGCQEASVHEMALVSRQILVTRRGRYDPSDHPFIATSLRKLAPGPETEAVLKRLAGEKIAFRQLIATEDQAYLNPIDGKTYVAPGGWRTYQPQPGVKREPADEKVKLEHVRLLTPEDEIASRTSIEDLAKFIKRAEQIASKVFGKSDKRLKLLVEFTCSPSGHELQIAHQPEDVNKGLLQAFHNALTKMDKLRVKNGKLVFQAQWTVSP